MKKKADAAITVFFALISAIILGLLLLVLESARTEGARLYMTIAANSSIDSLFSQYHKKLWEEYRLLGLEYYAPDQITDEMSAFMEPYLKADNWYPMKLKSMDIEDMRLLTDDDAAFFEEEILDYMKYGIAASIWNYLEAGKFTEGIKQGSSVNGLTDIYEDHSKEAMRLEEAIDAISECIQSLSQHYSEATAHLDAYNGTAFIHSAEQMKSDLSRIPGLVNRYKTQAEKMEEGLKDSKSRLEAEKAAGNISEETYTSLSVDISEYESYVSEDGSRRQEIMGFVDRADRGRDFLDDMIAEAEAVEEYIDNWEPSEDDDGEEEELDLYSLWEPLISRFSGFDLLSLNAKHGIADKETEKKLENIKTILESNLLKLVLPEGASLSTDSLKMEDKPSETCFSGNAYNTTEVLDRVYIAEYISSVMDYFGRGSYDAGSKKTGSGSMEVEYVIFGKETDTENVSAVVKRLVEIRTGLNLSYLYTDSVKRKEAHALALQITGAFGLTPLVAVAAFFIMGVWALGQAVCDVRDLLAGKKVPFIHNSSSFYLTLTGLLDFASGNIRGSEGTGNSGLKYMDYLKMLLFFGHDNAQDYRAMDVIQMFLRQSQFDFQMDRLLYSLEMDVSVDAAHLFSALGIAKAQSRKIESNYTMNVSTAYSY